MTRTRSTTDEVMELVREIPGITSGQVIEFMPHARKQTVYSVLNAGYARGLLLRDAVPREPGKGGPTGYAWRMNDAPRAAVRKLKTATSLRAHEVVVSGTATLDFMRNRVTELENWQRDAIERYPDLAVPATTLKARQIVAQEIGDSDPAMRDAVLAGQRDGSLPMRLTVKLLDAAA